MVRERPRSESLGPENHCRRVALGIDPGIAISGYACVAANDDELGLLVCGAITTFPHQSLPARLAQLHRGILEVIDRYGPTEVAIEAVYFNKNVRTALAVGHGRGVALLAAAQRGLSVDEYTPLQVKQAVTGYGRASKSQVQAMVSALLGLQTVPEPDDAADAAAVAICHLHMSAVRRALAERGAAGV